MTEQHPVAPAVAGTTGRVASGVLLALWLGSMTALLSLVSSSAPEEVTSSGGIRALVVVCVLGVVVSGALVLVNGAARGGQSAGRALATAAGVVAAVAGLLVLAVVTVVVRDQLIGGEAAGTVRTFGAFAVLPLAGAAFLALRSRSAVSRLPR
ncbi:MAG: hypothetical protein JWP95_1303 [Actinotalea sp.]|nr:hypothetical protein [Actinotalea sp.]